MQQRYSEHSKTRQDFRCQIEAFEEWITRDAFAEIFLCNVNMNMYTVSFLIHPNDVFKFLGDQGTCLSVRPAVVYYALLRPSVAEHLAHLLHRSGSKVIEQTTYWHHDLRPFLLKFPENPLGLDGIRYYGLSYLLGFLGAWLLLRAYNSKGKFLIDADARSNLVTAIIIGVLAGGRFGYVLFYDLEAFWENPLLLFRVDQGGMSSHGGFIGVAFAVLWFSWRQKVSLLKLSDVIVTLAPLGIMFGRIANFINGELWGRVSYVSWAVIFPNSPATYDSVLGTHGPQPRHPSQLYAAGLEGALLLAYAQWRFWLTKPKPGQLCGEFLIGYSLVRIFGELFREPDASLILGITRGQFYSIFLGLAGAFLIYATYKRCPNTNSA